MSFLDPTSAADELFQRLTEEFAGEATVSVVNIESRTELYTKGHPIDDLRICDAIRAMKHGIQEAFSLSQSNERSTMVSLWEEPGLIRACKMLSLPENLVLTATVKSEMVNTGVFIRILNK